MDRRFAVLAAGQAANDPAARYAVDLLTGPRKEGEQRALLASYLDLVARVERLSPGPFLERFGEVARVLGHTGIPADSAAMQVVELYRRHAQQVTKVIDDAIRDHAPAIRRRELPPSCLLRIVFEDAASGEGVAADERPKPPPSPPGDNYFVRRGRSWAIRFNGGEEQTYTPERGLEYLRVLLERPGVGHAAVQLKADVCRREFAGKGRKMGAGGEDLSPESATAGADVMDAETEEACESRLRDIAEARAVFEAGSAPDRLDQIEELDKERLKIDAFLKAGRGKGGRKRKTADVRERVRKSVGNAIRRALKQIHAYDRELFEHLKSPTLTLGRTPTYDPRDGTTWHVAD